jgi:hypothetical protein
MLAAGMAASALLSSALLPLDGGRERPGPGRLPGLAVDSPDGTVASVLTSMCGARGASMVGASASSSTAAR